MSAALASWSPKRSGTALIDAQTPLSFIVGFAAGIFGIDPSLAMLTFVGAKVVDQSLSAGTERALFRRDTGESLGNQLTDVLVNFAGTQIGAQLRGRLAEQPAPEVPVSGLGIDYHDPLTRRYEDYMRYPRIL